MKIQYFSAAVFLAIGCAVAAKSVLDESTRTNTIPISWSDVESGSQKIKRANQGHASKRDPGKSGAEGSFINTGHVANSNHDDKHIENTNPLNHKRDEIELESYVQGGGQRGTKYRHGSSSHPQKRQPVRYGQQEPADAANTAAALLDTATSGSDGTAGNAEAAVSNSGTSSGACEGQGSGCTGDVTQWDGGLGACGWTVDSGSEFQIALPHGLMGTQSNGNPYCGRSLIIKNPTTGATISATVGDKCMGCDGYNIDLTNALFDAVAPGCDGRCSGFEWWFD